MTCSPVSFIRISARGGTNIGSEACSNLIWPAFPFLTTANGWFAARPSGTENIYKIYAESFKDEAHLKVIQEEAQAVVDGAIETLKKGLTGVVELAEPLTTVAGLVAKAWTGMP